MAGTGIVVIAIGYLLGSVPSAYVITRLVTGKDIRKLGGGNVGARNTFREVGKAAGVAVGIFDVAKGTAAVAIAYWLLNVPLFEPHPLVLAAGFAAVVGHLWSIYLKFTGGNGLATAMGVLVLLTPRGLLIVVAITLLLIPITRNPILSVNISLLSVPLSAWLLVKSGALVIFFLIMLLTLILHFMPIARAAKVKAGSNESFFAELLRRDKRKKRGNKATS